MRIDWDDDRFVDEPHKAAFRDRALGVDAPSGDHDAKIVAVGNQVAWIDAGVAELIYLLWRAGVATDESCQDILDDGTAALLSFPDADELRGFLKAAVPSGEEPGGLYDRATGCNFDPGAVGGWEYSCYPKDWGNGYVLPMSVAFPVSDVPQLVGNLKS